ncbi:MAG: substrate-binding domain-containing protein, partial [Planctomycetota bacterium]
MLPRPLPRLLAFASVALVLGCSGGSAADPVVLTGSSTLAPLMSSLAAAYEAEHPGLRIDVQSGGSGQGIRDARSGLAAFGMVSRSLAAGEEDLQAWPVARDGIGVVVHAERDLAGLDSATLRAVYRGEIR